MEFKIRRHKGEGGGYYPSLFSNDRPIGGYYPVIADHLGMPREEYINYMKQYRARSVINLRRDSCSPIYIFNTSEDCQNFIESKELEPYMIMGKLIE